MHCKSLTTLVIFSLLIISSLPVAISYNITSNDIIYVDDGVSFNVNLTGPRFWYAIKMKSNVWVNVTIEREYYLSTSNDTIKNRGFFIFTSVLNEDNTAGYSMGYFGTAPSSSIVPSQMYG